MREMRRKRVREKVKETNREKERDERKVRERESVFQIRHRVAV